MSDKEEKKIKRQIIVLFDFSASAENALKHGIQMCKVLKSGLTITFPLIKNMSNEKREEMKQQLAHIVTHLQQNTELDVQAFAPSQPLKKFYKPLYEKIEGIMIVAGIEGKNFVCGMTMQQYLRCVRNSRIPWLAVPPSAPVNDYTHIVLPLSYSRQTKEKIAWASYFHRLNQSAIHALTPVAKDGFIKTGIYKNTEFLKKMYNSLEVYYKLIPTDKNIHHIDPYAIDYALEHSAAPVIILVSPRPDIFDIVLGAAERKIILNSENIPVLCITPLDDMYVVCS